VSAWLPAGPGQFSPLDVTCTLCNSPPGTRCRSVVIDSRPMLRRPHAPRVTAAREASRARSQPRAPAGVSDAWTCPTCSRSYWPPAEWEHELWPPVRRVAQQLHATRHAREAGAGG
jgi:hypothetical protein